MVHAVDIIDGRETAARLAVRGKDCCKQSDPEQFGCPSALRLLDVYGESETPPTQHRRLHLLRSSKTGETSGVCLRSQAKLITQSAKRMKVNVNSFLISALSLTASLDICCANW